MFNQKEWGREYRKNNKEKIKEYLKKWRENNPKYNKQYYQNNIEKERERSLQWKKDNPEKAIKYAKQYREKNYEDILKREREYHRKNRGRDKKNHKEWVKANPDYYTKYYEKNKEKIRSQYDQKYHNQYRKIKRINNPKFRLDEKVGWIIWQGLKRKITGRNWSKLLFYTRKELAEHLEKQFTPKMNWDNYGTYWEIDHIIPISAFNYNKPEDIDFKRCWALDNLQPLTKEENLKKGNKIEYLRK